MKKLELTDFYDYKFLSGITFAPNKVNALFMVKTADKANNGYKSNLWLLDSTTKQIKQLTSLGDIGLFTWLNNNEVIFTAMRDSEIKEKAKNGETWTIVYKLSLDGGEAVEFFRLPRIITGIKAADENKIVISMLKANIRPDIESMDDVEKTKALAEQKANLDYEVIDELPFWGNGAGFTNGKRNEVYVYDVKEKELTSVCQYPFDASIEEVKNGTILYTVDSFENGLADMKNSLWSYNIATGENKELIAKGDWRVSGAGFSADKTWVLATNNDSYGLNQNPKLYFFEDGKLNVWLDKDISYGSSVGSDCRLGGGKQFFTCDYGVAFVSTENYNSCINTLTLSGNHVILPMKNGSVDCFDKSADGTLYFIGMRDNKLQELYGIKNGVEEKITSFNDDVLNDKSLIIPEHFTFENDGNELDGFVLKPVNFDENKKYPAILDIHGGPKTVFGDVFFHEMQVWANMGYFVFYTNSRGGDGRGNEFADIRGHYGKEDYSDIMKFTDIVLERYPQIDEKRVGVTGGSYGGFMTNWIIGHTDRFAAAASQRSISNWISMGYISDIGYFFSKDQTDSTPWTDVDKMWEQSPLKYADKVKTPTLFIHSDEDYRCPLAEGLQMFSALKYHGIDARLCMFKGENHELSRSGKPLHRQRRLDEITNWFEKYLKA